MLSKDQYQIQEFTAYNLLHKDAIKLVNNSETNRLILHASEESGDLASDSQNKSKYMRC